MAACYPAVITSPITIQDSKIERQGSSRLRKVGIGGKAANSGRVRLRESEDKKQKQLSVLKLRFLLYSVLGFVLGLTWVLALTAIFVDGQSLEIWITFIILHGIQVCVAHCINPWIDSMKRSFL